MPFVIDANITVLKFDLKAPLLVWREGAYVIMREYAKILRLGPSTAKWLYEALVNIYLPECPTTQEIHCPNGKRLQVLNESKYKFIIAPDTRFVMQMDVLDIFVLWLSENTI